VIWAAALPASDSKAARMVRVISLLISIPPVISGLNGATLH
jgi:hypothetical protein